MSATTSSVIFFETIKPDTVQYARETAYVAHCISIAWEAIADQDSEMFHEALRNLTNHLPADHALITELRQAHTQAAKAALAAFTPVPSKPQFALRQIAALASTIASAMTPSRSSKG